MLPVGFISGEWQHGDGAVGNVRNAETFFGFALWFAAVGVQLGETPTDSAVLVSVVEPEIEMGGLCLVCGEEHVAPCIRTDILAMTVAQHEVVLGADVLPAVVGVVF